MDADETPAGDHGPVVGGDELPSTEGAGDEVKKGPRRRGLFLALLVVLLVALVGLIVGLSANSGSTKSAPTTTAPPKDSAAAVRAAAAKTLASGGFDYTFMSQGAASVQGEGHVSVASNAVAAHWTQDESSFFNEVRHGSITYLTNASIETGLPTAGSWKAMKSGTFALQVATTVGAPLAVDPLAALRVLAAKNSFQTKKNGTGYVFHGTLQYYTVEVEPLKITSWMSETTADPASMDLFEEAAITNGFSLNVGVNKAGMIEQIDIEGQQFLGDVKSPVTNVMNLDGLGSKDQVLIPHATGGLQTVEPNQLLPWGKGAGNGSEI